MKTIDSPISKYEVVRHRNLAIAEYMASREEWSLSYDKEGLKFFRNPWSRKVPTYDDNMKVNGFYYAPDCNFQFHNSWNWLTIAFERLIVEESIHVSVERGYDRHGHYVQVTVFDKFWNRYYWKEGIELVPPSDNFFIAESFIDAFWMAISDYCLYLLGRTAQPSA